MKMKLVLVLFAACACPAFAQGPLAPPGAPAPTMKSLDQVEPRTPITNVPYEISAPGSYYLCGSLTGIAGTNGITVNASDVTLDLFGHALIGVPGSVDGINVKAGRRTIVIRNGIVSHWGGDGVNAGASSVSSVQVEELLSNTNGSAGVRVNSLSSVLRCQANENNGHGIVGVGVSILVKDCVASFNKLDGINLPTSSSVIDCTARDNFDDGIVLAGGAYVAGCSSVANDAAGIVVSGPGSTVVNCSIAASGQEGLRIGSETYAFNNNVDQSGSGGVHANILVTLTGNRLEANHAIGGDIGISVQSNRNFVIRNTVGGSLSGTNYQVVAGNFVGPINNVSAGGTITNVNPWTNFEY